MAIDINLPQHFADRIKQFESYTPLTLSAETRDALEIAWKKDLNLGVLRAMGFDPRADEQSHATTAYYAILKENKVPINEATRIATQATAGDMQAIAIQSGVIALQHPHRKPLAELLQVTLPDALENRRKAEIADLLPSKSLSPEMAEALDSAWQKDMNLKLLRAMGFNTHNDESHQSCEAVYREIFREAGMPRERVFSLAREVAASDAAAMDVQIHHLAEKYRNAPAKTATQTAGLKPPPLPRAQGQNHGGHERG